MNLSRFFIDRPIFAGVLSLIIFLAGLISMGQLPISEYPEVVPPSVVVHAQFPGANPEVIAETVAAPLEEQINGIENMIYMFSQGTSDGQMTLTVTFKIGTNPDLAQQLVQNRVNQALPRLPDIVRQFGVTTIKSSPDLTMVVHILSPKGHYDMLYLANYATLNIKDRLSRIEGVGQVQMFGGSDYAMRLWLNPEKIASRGMSADEVINAIRDQNVQVAAGVIGESPSGKGVNLQLNVNTQGRLQSEEEFGDIIIKTDEKGAVTRLKDVARIELGNATYSLRSLLDNKPAVALGISQAPGSNSLQISDQVRAAMKDLKKNFPEDVDYAIVYDPTSFVRESIRAVIHTLLEAIALVVLVVILFLQTWRASIIPLLAVPVSIVGTFALLHLLGFSINALSLFGLVLAIGIVVDDAIVVVENVERNIEAGLSPKEASYQAMREVSGPIIAIALSLIAVFVPIAFISGLTGQFYRQFALTIAISTVISAFNSLTLSPAIAALLLKGHDAKPDMLTRVSEKIFGGIFSAYRWLLLAFALVLLSVVISLILGYGPVTAYMFMGLKYLVWIILAIAAVKAALFILAPAREGEPQGFDRFNIFFKSSSEKYSRGVNRVLGHKPLALMVYVILIGATVYAFKTVPTGYIPAQDKQYLIGVAQLPDGASLDRTEEVIRQMSDITMKTKGVDHSVAFPGLSVNGFTNSSSAGIVFLPLDGFDERNTPQLSAGALAGAINGQFGAAVRDAFVFVLPPPPILGLGTSGGFKLQLEDRADLGSDKLSDVKNAILGKAYQTKELDPHQTYSGFQVNVPQLYVTLDRTKAKQLGIPITSIFSTMQVYLGSLYINDFNRFGRTYEVIAQADAKFRSQADDIVKLKVKNLAGQMIPLGSVLTVKQSYGPERAMRYNAYRTADINSGPKQGYSSGQAQAALEKIVKETIPKGMGYEWTELTYQQIITGNSSTYVFPLCVLLVFLVLAAQYESLTLPLAVILIVPMSLLCAITGVWFSGGDNNIFTQIGLIVLVGLACKNAILIVEFARELEIGGESPLNAAVHAARMRLRPILMTSFAFIMGVVPLVYSSGAGSEMRHAMGVAVFWGMLGVTFFGLFLTPVFYVAIRTFVGSKIHSASAPAIHSQMGGGHE